MDRKKYKVREIIGSYLSLEKRGSNFWALCPFHDDSRASLSVSEEKNIFKCFSCGASGDAISFIMRREKLDFPRAVLRAHEILKWPTEDLHFLKKSSPEEELRQQLHRFNQFMLEFYSNSLYSPRGSAALRYLKVERNLTDEIIKKFQLGYAPSASEVVETLKNVQKVSPEFKFATPDFLVQTGQFYLLGDKLVHSFRDRIIFPIFNSEGQAISFSARAIGGSDHLPRYLHSRETLLFKKSECLYNVQVLKSAAADSFVYIFEGFFEVYTANILAPGGIYLALLGSELNDDALNILSDFPSKKIVLALDNDEIGIAATFKLLPKVLKFGFQLYALPPLSGKDLSETYRLNSSVKLPAPIPLKNWIDVNWSKLFPGAHNEKKLFNINQLALSLLSNFFYTRSAGAQLLLKSGITPQNALSALTQMFELYGLIQLSEGEKKILDGFKARYFEAVNMQLLVSNQETYLLYEEQIESEKIEATLVDELTIVIAKLEAVSRVYSAAIFLQTRESQWYSSLIQKYELKLQLLLNSAEKELLSSLEERIAQLTTSLTPMGESLSVEKPSTELLNFLEDYYSSVHQLINKYEKFIKSGPKLALKERIVILDEITQDREELHSQSARIFKEVLSWERSCKS
nr:CHC2 zinc finger domain-containing protein [Candidatus Mycoplasma haematominutum]